MHIVKNNKLSPGWYNNVVVRMMTVTAVIILFIMIAKPGIAASDGKAPILTTNTVEKLFARFIHPETKKHYKLSDIKIKVGSYTGRGRVEAIVSFYDDNRLYWQSPSEIWLVRFENEWTLVRQLACSQGVDFRVVDINDDNQYELFIYEGTTQHGAHYATNRLIALNGISIKTLYENKEVDTEGSQNESRLIIETIKYQTRFADIDQDGHLEIIETMTKTTLARTETCRSNTSRHVTYIPIGTKEQKVCYKIII